MNICHACNRQYEPTRLQGRNIVCQRDGCREWLVDYAAWLKDPYDSECPSLLYDDSPMPKVVPIGQAPKRKKRTSREVTKAIEREAFGNDLHREARLQHAIADRGEEVIHGGAYL